MDNPFGFITVVFITVVFITVVAAVDMEARCIEMSVASTEPQAGHGLLTEQCKQFADPEGMKCVECFAQGVVMEVFGSNAWRNQALGWFVRKEVRAQVQAPVGETEAVENHGFDGLADTDLALCVVLLDKLIDAFDNS